MHLARTDKVDAWFLRERGITAETLDYFKVRVEDNAVIYPYPTGEKCRKLDEGGEPSRQFYSAKGLELSLYGVQEGEKSEEVAFICEGETDTMRLQQELGYSYRVYGLSGVNGWRTDMARLFEGCQTVFLCLDNDSDYTVAGRVDTTWNTIRTDIGRKARRIVLPHGIKDICEFFKSYGIDDLRRLSSKQQFAYNALDLLGEPPRINWLVENLIASGDVNLLMGDPGLGKSWIAMALATAVAEGLPTFIGHTLDSPGRVLYIDEENPEDIIYDRFRKLGLTSSGADNLRFLYRQGIQLDKSPDALIEEAILYDPQLVVIDSLSRVHTQDENSAGAMSGLFKFGIMPLARDTGAAVILIHHSNKADTSSGFKRSRGSGDITAAVDAAFDVRPGGVPGQFILSTYKSRRRPAREEIQLNLVDSPDDTIRLEATNWGGSF